MLHNCLTATKCDSYGNWFHLETAAPFSTVDMCSFITPLYTVVRECKGTYRLNAGICASILSALSHQTGSTRIDSIYLRRWIERTYVVRRAARQGNARVIRSGCSCLA